MTVQLIKEGNLAYSLNYTLFVQLKIIWFAF